jgi:signal peptidase
MFINFQRLSAFLAGKLSKVVADNAQVGRMRLPHTMFSPYVIFIASYGLFQLYYFIASDLGYYGSYLAYLAAYAALFGIFLFFSGTDLGKFGLHVGRNSLQKILGTSIFLSLIYIVIKMEPGFSYGFASLGIPTLFLFGFFLSSSPLVALSEESVFRGYIFRNLSLRMTFERAILLSSFLYGLQLTSIPALLRLSGASQIQYVFTNTLSGVALGIAMCFFFYKLGWSLFGPIIFRTIILYQNYLFPIGAKSPSWELTFVFGMIAIGAVIVAINAFLREPRFMTRKFLGEGTKPIRFRMLRKQRGRWETKRVAKEAIAVGAIVLIVLVILPAAGFSSQYRAYAIASGSMEPTFYRGDLLIFQKVANPQQIHVGDVVAYNSTVITGTVTHRVISELTTAQGLVLYTTKGDNNPSPDPVTVPFSRIEGVAVYEIPLVGYLVLSPPLTVSILVVIALISLSTQRPMDRTERRRKQRISVMLPS